LIYHEEHKGHEEAGGKGVFYVVFFMAFVVEFGMAPPGEEDAGARRGG
jgi:hypothetical protein